MSITRIADILLHKFPYRMISFLENPFLKKGTEQKPEFEFNHEFSDEVYSRIALLGKNRTTVAVPPQIIFDKNRTFQHQFYDELKGILESIENLPDALFADVDIDLKEYAAQDERLSRLLEDEIAQHQELREQLLKVQEDLIKEDLCPL